MKEDKKKLIEIKENRYKKKKKKKGNLLNDDLDKGLKSKRERKKK